jgi:hypothetical protein
MLQAFVLIAIAGWLPGAEAVAHYRPNLRTDAEKAESFLVGQVFIIGIGSCPACIFEDLLQLYSAQRCTRSDLHTAEKRFAPLIIFGIKTKITLLDPDCDNEIQDILVKVEATSFSRVVIWIYSIARSTLCSITEK